MIGKKTGRVMIIRDDECDINVINKFNPCGIIISPGPGRPEEAITSNEIIKNFAGRIPLLGVCLGLQIIASFYGSLIVTSVDPKHGKVSKITNDGKSIFRGLPPQFKVMRYHSLQIKNDTLASDLTISAVSDDNVIMGIRHKTFRLEAVQFHPESVMTEYGEELIDNWLRSL